MLIITILLGRMMRSGLMLGSIQSFIGDVESLALSTMVSVHLLHLEEKMKKLFAGFIATAAAALLSAGSASAQCKPQAGMLIIQA